MTHSNRLAIRTRSICGGVTRGYRRVLSACCGKTTPLQTLKALSYRLHKISARIGLNCDNFASYRSHQQHHHAQLLIRAHPAPWPDNLPQIRTFIGCLVGPLLVQRVPQTRGLLAVDSACSASPAAGTNQLPLNLSIQKHVWQSSV